MQIWKEFNAKLKRHEWQARFRYNKKQFRVKKETKDDLEKLIAEIKEQERIEIENKKYGMTKEVVSYVPTISELFDDITKTIPKHHQKISLKESLKPFSTFCRH